MLAKTETIQIAGAGLAGLSAAITLAIAGRNVIVRESRAVVGARFNGDFQGLENWTGSVDVIDWLKSLGIECDFHYQPFSYGTAFDAWGESYPITSNQPLFYLVERGPGAESLDSALLRKALVVGVEVKFNDKVTQLSGPGIIATGPKAADAIAVGYHFETSMPDGFWTILDDNLAPKGYSYLLVMNGRGTVKTCMFEGFKQQDERLKKTVDAFTRLVGLEMRNPKFHGGVGNFSLPKRGSSGIHPKVGELAGFQDPLWGFGMRFAIHSGVLAAQSLIQGVSYQKLWRTQMKSPMRVATVNRWIFQSLGNRGYRSMLKLNRRKQWDAKEKLFDIYKSAWFKCLLYPIANRWVEFKRDDASCNHIDCGCIWCRHGEH